jgi:hypothetical protein
MIKQDYDRPEILADGTVNLAPKRRSAVAQSCFRPVAAWCQCVQD